MRQLRTLASMALAMVICFCWAGLVVFTLVSRQTLSAIGG